MAAILHAAAAVPAAAQLPVHEQVRVCLERAAIRRDDDYIQVTNLNLPMFNLDDNQYVDFIRATDRGIVIITNDDACRSYAAALQGAETAIANYAYTPNAPGGRPNRNMAVDEKITHFNHLRTAKYEIKQVYTTYIKKSTSGVFDDKKFMKNNEIYDQLFKIMQRIIISLHNSMTKETNARKSAEADAIKSMFEKFQISEARLEEARTTYFNEINEYMNEFGADITVILNAARPATTTLKENGLRQPPSQN